MRDEWAQRDLYLFDLPTYSPELNLIEIVWRFMKYEWIDITVYKSWKSLVNHVEEMLIANIPQVAKALGKCIVRLNVLS
jgi:transposase